MIVFMPKERGWEESEHFAEFLNQSVAQRIENELRLRLTGDDELFAPEQGKVIRRLEVRDDASGIEIEVMPPAGQDELWDRTIKQIMREAMDDLPLEEASDAVRQRDPLIQMPPVNL